MLYDGIKLFEGSVITNPTVAVGPEFPSLPDQGELFFASGAGAPTIGLYFYNGTSWIMIAALNFTPEDVANKNVANGYAGLDGTGAINSAQIPATLSNKTLNTSTFSGSVTESIYSIPGTVIASGNGSIQTKVLSSNTTFTESINDGQSVTLLIQSGAFTVTWPTVYWKTNGGIAPSLNASGFTVIELFKVGGTLFGARVGDA